MPRRQWNWPGLWGDRQAPERGFAFQVLTNAELHSPLPPEASSARRARLLMHEALAGWDLSAIEEVASLLVSELVTNVVLHARGPCDLQICFDGRRLCIGVWDTNPNPPVRVLHPGLAASGRGLALVEALAADWGWAHSGNDGKVVWFELEP
jgi:anti-sigma regulatory factor (Ser/Thr protein kinase)